MKKLFTTIAILFFGVKCSSPTLPKLPVGFEYTITEDRLERGLERYELRVKINQKISETVIKDLSQWLKDNRTDAPKMIIFYYRTDKEFSGAWARVDYDPEYKVEIIATPIL